MIPRNTPRLTVEASTLQYANGKSVARSTLGSGRFAPFVGFHVEAGKDQDLDRVFLELKTPQIEIKHQRQGGAEIVRHWNLGESIRFFVVTAGPVAPTVADSLRGPNARLTAEAGIGMRWGQGERSKVAIRGYVRELADSGLHHLFQISVRSRMTDRLLGAMLDHYRVLEAADALAGGAQTPYHAIAMSLGPGEEEEWGKGDTATIVPLRSLHPEEIAPAYVNALRAPEWLDAWALADWPSIQAWAAEYASGGGDEYAQADRPDEETAE